MTPLADYFRSPDLARNALDAYAAFSAAAGWPIQHKLEMYAHTRAAFDDPLSFEAFRRIDDNLKG